MGIRIIIAVFNQISGGDITCNGPCFIFRFRGDLADVVAVADFMSILCLSDNAANGIFSGEDVYKRQALDQFYEIDKAI